MKDILLISTIVVLTSCSKQQEVKVENQPIEEIRIIEVDSVPGKKQYTISEEVYWILPDEQESHFEEAKAKHEKKEFQAAAAEIQLAVLYLNHEMDNASSESKQDLSLVRDNLINIEERLEKGDKVTEIELRQAFYQTNKTLYRNYINQQADVTLDYDLEKNNVDARLDAAIQRVRNAEKWSGKKLDSESNGIIEEGKSLSHKIKESTKQDKEVLAKSWNEFLKKLKRLDEKLEGNSGVY